MNRIKTRISAWTALPTCLAISSAVFTASGMPPAAARAELKQSSGTSGAEDEKGEKKDNEPAVKQKRIVIHSGEPSAERKEVAWLGLGTAEAPEVLAAQMDLKQGEGLVVAYVAPDSPASRAGFQKNDLLVEFDGQRLVHPAQFRKLVQMHKEGDSVEVAFYRAGKKQSVSVALGKTKAGVSFFRDENSWQGDLRDLHVQLENVPATVHAAMKKVHEAVGRLNEPDVRIHVMRSLEEAHKAIGEAVHGSAGMHAKKKSVKTVVKTDDTGSLVIVANPKKRLTAHDQDGKLLFDGEIETEEQQAKVPAEVWEKVKPMLKQMEKGASGDEEIEDLQLKRNDSPDDRSRGAFGVRPA